MAGSWGFCFCRLPVTFFWSHFLSFWATFLLIPFCLPSFCGKGENPKKLFEHKYVEIGSEKRHRNTYFLLRWGSGWPWDNRPVDRPEKVCVLLQFQTIKHFLLVDQLGVPRLNSFSKIFVIKLYVYNLLGPLQGSFGPFGPEIPKKSKKSSRGLSAPKVEKRLKKSWKKVEKVEKRLFLTRFWPFFRLFFQPFLTLGPRGPGNFFSTFWDFGPEGPEWPL